MLCLRYMNKNLFYLVADSLLWIGRKTGLTYNEVNILVYYLLIPLSWAGMVDCLLGGPYFTVATLMVWAGIWSATRGHFRQWCDRAFMASVRFLNWFNRLGSNYILSSIIICVIIPLMIYATLIAFTFSAM